MISSKTSIKILIFLLTIIVSFVQSNTEIIKIENSISPFLNQECSGSDEPLLVPGLIHLTTNLTNHSTTKSFCLHPNHITTPNPQTHRFSPNSFLQHLTSISNHLSFHNIKTYTVRTSWSASDHIDINLSYHQLNRLIILIDSNHDSLTKSIGLDVLIEPVYFGFLPQTSISLIISLLVLVYFFIYFQIYNQFEKFLRLAIKDT